MSVYFVRFRTNRIASDVTRVRRSRSRVKTGLLDGEPIRRIFLFLECPLSVLFSSLLQQRSAIGFISPLPIFPHLTGELWGRGESSAAVRPSPLAHSHLILQFAVSASDLPKKSSNPRPDDRRVSSRSGTVTWSRSTFSVRDYRSNSNHPRVSVGKNFFFFQVRSKLE